MKKILDTGRLYFGNVMFAYDGNGPLSGLMTIERRSKPGAKFRNVLTLSDDDLVALRNFLLEAAPLEDD